MTRRLFWLAPLTLFLSGCAVSARGADVPQIADIAAESATALPGYAEQDPVQLVNTELHDAFDGSAYASATTSITETNGVVIILLDRPATTLSGAELFLRFCQAAADVIETPNVPSSVKGVAVVQPDGRTIAAATIDSPACFYR